MRDCDTDPHDGLSQEDSTHEAAQKQQQFGAAPRPVRRRAGDLAVALTEPEVFVAW